MIVSHGTNLSNLAITNNDAFTREPTRRRGGAS